MEELEINNEVIEYFKNIYNEYKDKLKPNKKSFMETINYLNNKYKLIELKDNKYKEVILNNIYLNVFYRDKIKSKRNINARIFTILNEGNGKYLYDHQQEVFKGYPIIVGLEEETSFLFVEGSKELLEELTIFQGLDEKDLENYYIVASYVLTLKKHNIL